MSDPREIPSPDPSTPPHNPGVQPPLNRYLRTHGYDMPPGPGRKFDARHWARQEGMGWLVMLLIVAVAFWFYGWDIGLWRDLFG